jgi:hypothetical protein
LDLPQWRKFPFDIGDGVDDQIPEVTAFAHKISYVKNVSTLGDDYIEHPS